MADAQPFMARFMVRARAGLYPDAPTMERALDDAIDEWHASPDGLDLHTFLGMTSQEYVRWVQSPSSLGDIVREPAGRRP